MRTGCLSCRAAGGECHSVAGRGLQAQELRPYSLLAVKVMFDLVDTLTTWPTTAGLCTAPAFPRRDTFDLIAAILLAAEPAGNDSENGEVALAGTWTRWRPPGPGRFRRPPEAAARAARRASWKASQWPRIVLPLPGPPRRTILHQPEGIGDGPHLSDGGRPRLVPARLIGEADVLRVECR